MEAERKPDSMAFFGRVLNENRLVPVHPCWRYHKINEPILVHNTDEDEACKLEGYNDPRAPMIANQQLVNWYWDLEDLSAKQLVCFAQEEYDVDLPVEAGQEHLMKCIIDLSRWAPQNRNRLVLMAHTMTMNYDATLEQIKEMSTFVDREGYECIQERTEMVI